MEIAGEELVAGADALERDRAVHGSLGDGLESDDLAPVRSAFGGARGARVGDVLGDGVDAGALGEQAALGDPRA